MIPSRSPNWQEFQRITSQRVNLLLQGIYPVATSTTSITVADATRLQLVDATGAAVTISLPAAVVSTNRILTIKKTDASVNAVTIDPSGAETVDGVATRTLPNQWDSMMLVCDGVAWFRI